MSKENTQLDEWLEKAQTDYAAANHLLTLYPVPLELICYLSQQSGEKYLKAYLCCQNQENPKTHSLIKLYQMCKEIDVTFSEISKPASALTPYATSTRYPDGEEIFDHDMKLALEYAKTIANFVRAKLPELDDTGEQQ